MRCRDCQLAYPVSAEGPFACPGCGAAPTREKTMTVDDVRGRVAEIGERAKRGGNHVCHCLQDDLWFDVLVAIADGAEHAREMAAEAAKVGDVEFDRWYE